MVQRLANPSKDANALIDDLDRHAAHTLKAVHDTFALCQLHHYISGVSSDVFPAEGLDVDQVCG